MEKTKYDEDLTLDLCKARSGPEELALKDLLMIAKVEDLIDEDATKICKEDALLALWAARGVWEQYEDWKDEEDDKKIS